MKDVVFKKFILLENLKEKWLGKRIEREEEEEEEVFFLDMMDEDDL